VPAARPSRTHARRMSLAHKIAGSDFWHRASDMAQRGDHQGWWSQKTRRSAGFWLARWPAEQWRPRSESNRRTRICSPLHDHSATRPDGAAAIRGDHRLPIKQNPGNARFCWKTGAGNETRTRDPDLGKVVLYQLSYSRLVSRES